MSTPMQPGKVSGTSDLAEGLRLIMRGGGPKLVAAGLSLALLVGLAFISTVEANNRAHHQNLSASGSGSGDNGVGGGSAGSGGGANGANASAAGANGSGGGSGGGAGGGGTGARTAGGATGANTTGGNCPWGNNLDIGVTCNQVLVGGITVLSGPLGIYGEQGLQAAQAWLSYYNAVYAPAHHLPQEKLIYYDDHGADPSQDAILTQKLIEQDHVFGIGGMPAPQGANPYLVQHAIPLIGDLGLNPISYQSPMIWPTAPTPNTQVGANLDAKVLHSKFPGIHHIGAIISPLPGQDPRPLEQYETNAWKPYGVDVTYQVMTTSESDCNSHLLDIRNANPDFLQLPLPSTNFLLCIQAAQSQSYYPGSSLGGKLQGWFGGSGISVEMQQCGSLCATAGGGIVTGSIFLNPNDYSNHDPNSGMDLYNSLMSKYASNVDKTSIIAENYYVSAEIGSLLLAQAASTPPYLTRAHIIQLANLYKFDTGMGLKLDWADPPNTASAHIGTTCGYMVRAVQSSGGAQWKTDPTYYCG
ncbi:MAG TPA: ABC transporter substrate-binding protein [Acidimicrobiales bacterium]|nr:ABC transporter substrate-binding protein [Acidimicrobiales bacterium]